MSIKIYKVTAQQPYPKLLDTVTFLGFSDGSETCVLSKDALQPSISDNLLVQVRIEDCTKDLIRLGLVKDALSRAGYNQVDLSLNYIPQARADRVFQEGAPLPLKVFCDILNSYEYSRVFVCDPHSDVSPALIKNIKIVDQSALLARAVDKINEQFCDDFILCAPDLGAAKKVFDVAKAVKRNEYIQATKIRDVTTGAIVKCGIAEGEDLIDGAKILIVDDCADGGASFKYLAAKLKERGAEKVGLFVSHGIFSNGLDELKETLDYICVGGLVCNYINEEDINNFNNIV